MSKKRQKKRIVPMHVRCRVQSNLSFLCLVEKLTLPKNDPTSDFPKKSRLFQFSDDSLLASEGTRLKSLSVYKAAQK